MAITLNGTSGILFNDASNQTTAATGFGFKNRLINGAMVISQRNGTASFTPLTTNSYSLDRWRGFLSQSSKFTVQQNAGSITPPAGFTNYLGITSSSAYTSLTADYFTLTQNIEGFNTADLSFGTADAKTITISFWVRSSLTGTFGGSIANSAENRAYVFTYSISSTNTWEQKTITIAGDTTGTWLTTNGIGMEVNFSLGAGTTYGSGTANTWASSWSIQTSSCVNVVGTNGATFYITGVQLEKGSTATSFDYRPYGTELALCQRYYYKISGTGSNPFAAGGAISTTSTRVQGSFPVSLRTSPTALEQTGTSGNYQLILAGAAVAPNNGPTFDDATQNTFSVSVGYSATGSAGQAGWLRCNSTAAYLAWSAEL